MMPSGPASTRILVVDDSPLLLEVAADALRQAGYEVTVARDLLRVEQLVADWDPALILLDVRLPEAEGDDIAVVLKLVQRVSARILLHSALEPGELARRCRDAGCDGFVSKGDGVEAMVQAVTRTLAGGTAP